MLQRTSGHAVDPILLVGLTTVLRLVVDLHPRWGVTARVLALAPGTEASLAARAVAAARNRLRADGLLERQRALPAPRDVTRVAMMHPPDAAGWADVAGELGRWSSAGVLAVRSLPTAFEGDRAAAGLAAAVAGAIRPIDGHRPDLVLLVRGGGARAGFAPLDDEALASAIATCPVPIVTGLGHASDRGILAADICWTAADTPSKALAVLRELIVRPARRARADHAVALSAVAAGLDRAGRALDAGERRVAAAAQARAGAAAELLGAVWTSVVVGAHAARERLGRRGDALDALKATAAAAGSAGLDRCGAGIAAQVAHIRDRGRVAVSGAQDGGRQFATVAAQASARMAAAEAAARALRREVALAGRGRVDRVASDLTVLGEGVRARP